MKRNHTDVKYTFADPNPPREVQKLLKAMMVEKLLAAAMKGTADENCSILPRING